MKLTQDEINRFQKTVYDFYDKNRRDLPWRKTQDPYAILVSEVMLQQTQVVRVIEKYRAWIRRFPTPRELAQAEVNEILTYWTGLGYNRRALYLKQCADEIVRNRRGIFPTSAAALMKLPGVGAYTARAICVFSYNQPLPLIETNTRTVFIQHFFRDQLRVEDAALLPLIEQTMDKDNPRRWFNALFDYGSHIKSQVVNPTRKSNAYSKQSPLKGSVREVRGYILKQLVKEQPLTRNALAAHFGDENRVDKAIEGLVKDGLIPADIK